LSVSKTAIDTVYAQLKLIGPQTYEDLMRATGYSRATIKNAISYLKMQGSISMSMTKPTQYTAIETPPMPGQTLIVREALPPAELDSKIIESMNKAIDDPEVKVGDPVTAELFNRIRTADSQKLNSMLIVLVNLSEIIRERLTSDELDLSDIDPNSLKGKK